MGCRIPQTPIAVDTFRFYPGVYIYLLSHLHSDHTEGLTPSWNNGTIYCTRVSREILLHKFQINPHLVKVLEEDQVHNIALDPQRRVSMQVTLIDANHCPGSCMFLLEGYFGTVLHTGDFRFDPLVLEHEALRTKRDGQIDHLYLDDTFCDPVYDFPPRAEAGKEILGILSALPEDHRILIGTDTLGKEELLVAIACMLKTLVIVDEERLRTLNAMRRVLDDLPDVFTHDPSQGRVLALPKKEVNHRSVLKHRLEVPTIGICPSGWSTTVVGKPNERQPLTFNRKKIIYHVPYSLHSSFYELKQFVKTLRPKSLFSVSLRDNVLLRRYLDEYCSTEPIPQFVVPEYVKMCMQSKRKTLTMSGASSSSPNSRPTTPITPRPSPSPFLARKRKHHKRRGARILKSPPRPAKRISPPAESKPEVIDLEGTQDDTVPMLCISTQNMPSQRDNAEDPIVVDDSLQTESNNEKEEEFHSDDNDSEIGDALALLEESQELPLVDTIETHKSYVISRTNGASHATNSLMSDSTLEELLEGMGEEEINVESQLEPIKQDTTCTSSSSSTTSSSIPPEIPKHKDELSSLARKRLSSEINPASMKENAHTVSKRRILSSFAVPAPAKNCDALSLDPSSQVNHKFKRVWDPIILVDSDSDDSDVELIETSNAARQYLDDDDNDLITMIS